MNVSVPLRYVLATLPLTGSARPTVMAAKKDVAAIRPLSRTIRLACARPTVNPLSPRPRRGGARIARIDKADRRNKISSSLFNGIELNADQKTKLQALDRKIATERKTEAKKVREEARSAYINGVKDILTAEQYAKFELNRKTMQAKKTEKQEARKLKEEARKLKSEARKAQITASGSAANQ